jgi:hypothetical protein
MKIRKEVTPVGHGCRATAIEEDLVRAYGRMNRREGRTYDVVTLVVLLGFSLSFGILASWRRR